MLNSLVIAFSTYSKIPMPQVEWNEKNSRYSLCFFPFVGMVIGLCALAGVYVLDLLDCGKTLRAVFLTVLPLLISGGIHMDGFLDTVDAKSSWKGPEEKLKILKDPHTGAFAIIYGIVYLLIVFGLFGELTEQGLRCVALGYVYSRALSGFSVTAFRKAKKDGMAAASADAAAANGKTVLALEAAACALGLVILSPVCGAVCALCGLLCLLYYRNMAYRLFGGITGDLAGYFLQICELMILLCAVAVGKLLAL